MLLGFGYLYKFFMFYFFIFFKKRNIIESIKASWSKFCNIMFSFLLKIGSFRPVDKQINLVSPNKKQRGWAGSLRLEVEGWKKLFTSTQFGDRKFVIAFRSISCMSFDVIRQKFWTETNRCWWRVTTNYRQGNCSTC